MKKHNKTNSKSDIHVRIVTPLADKFFDEAYELGRKNTAHFEKILEERYNK